MIRGESHSAITRFTLVILALFFIALIAWLNRPGSDLQSYRAAHLPFGCIPSPQGGYAVQDFAYNLMYLRGIEERVVAHPYRQADQETLIHHALPTASSGMCHAYSPVALVVAAPFLALPPPLAYVAFSLLAALGLVLLYGLDLLPRAVDGLQLYLLIVCAVNITVVTAFAVGQSALLTTSLIGAVWFLLRREKRELGSIVLLAFLTWVLCLKPSIALIPLALLAGARAWSALGLTALLLAVTWAALGPLYGGWWNGLHDYANLLGHYYEDAMIPFMRDVFTRHPDTGANAYFSTLFPGHTALFFTASRFLFMGATALLLALRWMGRLTSSQQFRGMIWTFLMLCPYLLPSEDCILCLLIVEGGFFRSRNLLRDGALVLLMLAIMNLRAGLTFPGQINFPLKCALLAWMAVEAVRAGSRAQPRLPCESSPA
jgi:cbb3-type cytochrome oxidase subunit 3